MKRLFNVTAQLTSYPIITIEANSREEAEAKAAKLSALAWEGETGMENYDSTEIQILSEMTEEVDE